MAFEFWKSVQWFERSQGGGGDTPPTECVTRESSMGRGFRSNYVYDTYDVNVGKFAGREPWLVVIVRVYSDSGGAGES